MYQGRYNSKKAAPSRRRRTRKTPVVLMAALLLLVCTAVGGTLAWLTTNTDSVENGFIPSQVSCNVTEKFDGTTKEDVNVTNTSDISAYLRVKLVTYRVNEQGNHIGGIATVPNFTLGNGWVEKDGYYYYTHPVAPGKHPAANLIESIELERSYNDADGGKQVIEVMAEAIQAQGVNSDGTPAVTLAWNVQVAADGALNIH